MHAYGNIIHKDGVKSELATKGIYDYKTEQYYAPVDTLNKAFDLSLSSQQMCSYLYLLSIGPCSSVQITPLVYSNMT